MTQAPPDPFTDFPKTAAVKLLLAGEPGTRKTRRALASAPGPVYWIDMENGCDEYGDLVDDDRAVRFMRCSSTREFRAALKYLLHHQSKVGTVVVDPVSVLWELAQNDYIDRQISRGDAATAADVDLSVGAWGTIKRAHNPMIESLVAADFHLVLIARGGDKVDNKGRSKGFGIDGEKNNPHRVKTVVHCYAKGHDEVVKDRSNTWAVGVVNGRVDLADLFGASHENTVAAYLKFFTDSILIGALNQLDRDSAYRIALDDAHITLGWLSEQLVKAAFGPKMSSATFMRAELRRSSGNKYRVQALEHSLTMLREEKIDLPDEPVGGEVDQTTAKQADAAYHQSDDTLFEPAAP